MCCSLYRQFVKGLQKLSLPGMIWQLRAYSLVRMKVQTMLWVPTGDRTFVKPLVLVLSDVENHLWYWLMHEEWWLGHHSCRGWKVATQSSTVWKQILDKRGRSLKSIRTSSRSPLKFRNVSPFLIIRVFCRIKQSSIIKLWGRLSAKLMFTGGWCTGSYWWKNKKLGFVTSQQQESHWWLPFVQCEVS